LGDRPEQKEKEEKEMEEKAKKEVARKRKGDLSEAPATDIVVLARDLGKKKGA